MAAKKKGPAPEAEQPETETAPETVSGESAEGEVLDAPKAPDAEEKLRADMQAIFKK